MNVRLFASVSLSLCITTQQGYSQGLGQDKPATETLDQLTVVGQNDGTTGSLTSPTIRKAREYLETIPAGIGFVEAQEYSDNFTQSLGDTLVFTPGVYADTSAQRESRLSIRGSGLNASFERRGIIVYRDQVPITRASGITEFQEIDPVSIKYLEVFKGASGMRVGAAALGGAINIVTPTGQNSPEETRVRIEAGSFNTRRANLTTTGKQGVVDYYGSLSTLNSDGFRAHSNVDSVYGFGNIGWQVNERIETRFYITRVNDRFELAGSVSEQEALNHPDTALTPRISAGPILLAGNPIEDDWDRNLTVNRLANKTSIQFDHTQLDASLWWSNRSLDHAITRFAGIIDQDEDEYGISLHLSSLNNDSTTQGWSLGLMANTSENDAKRWDNNFGSRGNLSSQDTQNAKNATIFGQWSTPLSDTVTLVLASQYTYAFREEEGTGELTENGISTSLGLLWALNDDHQVYANISESFEPAGISDLTAGGVSDFDPLKAQTALTVEVGTRGQSANLTWDAALYYSKVSDEFIDTENPIRPNSTITTNSASNTIHQGIELGINYYPTIDVLERNGFSFSWRNSLTLNDFSFDNHPQFGSNTLAGAPDVIYITELRLDNTNDWYTTLNIRHIADGPYLDYANTTQTSGYTLLGLTAAWDVDDNMRVFASVENLRDKRYISNVSTVFEGDANDRLFTPGQGRAIYLGFSIAL